LTKEEALKLALETAEGFTNADWRKWKELASPDEFERWVKNRANHMIAIIKEALAQPAQEPEPDELTIAYMSGLLDGKKQRPWVGLTDDEIQECWDTPLTPYGMQHAKEMVAKLKEKNSAN